MSKEREDIRQGWYYVKLPEGTEGPKLIQREDGVVLDRRLHGASGRVQITDQTANGLHPVTLMRAVAMLEAQDKVVHVVLDEEASAASLLDDGRLRMNGRDLAQAPSPRHLPALDPELLAQAVKGPLECSRQPTPASKVLCFESLMNTDMPHNDNEISQGVLHMVSVLADSPTEVHFANIKMDIIGENRLTKGLGSLDDALTKGPFPLVCITLLEGYFEGVEQLIRGLRERGCRAHIAVGGVMPTLAPEHVMAHLPEVSFVCRGAGERFLRELCDIVGEGDVDTPMDQHQIDALLGLDGLLAYLDGPSGKTLISARADRVAEVSSLDRVRLDLSHVNTRHIVGGIEISTSRGCIHKCTFCSIMGREQYQARSAGGIMDVLQDYEARFKELYGEHIPRNAFRVHICDDDFACERTRAMEFFKALPNTPFRLSSTQVSVADLCVREDGKLTTTPDHEFLDTITPECFVLSERPLSERDFVADHRSRQWSSFLQIGVETFSDAELIRLGKGYSVDHIRAIVDALAARGIHMDAYFIQSNADTQAHDLIDGLDELCRTKMVHPIFFHLRFPIVPHLVSYFTSANYRRLVRHGREDVQTILRHVAVPNHPEYDYPFVSHDNPGDPWVAAAVEAGFFTDEERYTGSFEKLRAVWKSRLETLPDSEERKQGERLVRQLDDRGRRRCFELLSLARSVERGQTEWRPGIPSSGAAMDNAATILGPSQRWLKPFSRYAENTAPRLVVIPTWQCELRCRYCYIPKQDGRVMTLRTLERSIDMLLASDRPKVMLQFFGGEALIEWDLVRHGITYGREQAKHWGKEIEFIISSNGWSIDQEKLDWLREHPVKLELSLDGDRDTQNKFRRALEKGRDSYTEGIPDKAEMIRASGIPHEVIMVVHREAVGRMPENFFHIVSLGFPRVQINFALGAVWSVAQKQAFAAGLHTIGEQLKERWADGEEVSLINLEGRPMPIRLNGEVTVDWDGTVYGGNAFLHETEHKQKFVTGHLDDLRSFDRYWMDGPSNDYLLDWSYPPDITKNNLEVGRIFRSFHQWMATDEVRT